MTTTTVRTKTQTKIPRQEAWESESGAERKPHISKAMFEFLFRRRLIDNKSASEQMCAYWAKP